MFIDRWRNVGARLIAPVSVVLFLLTLLLAACGGPSNSQTQANPTPSPTPAQGQQLLTTVGQKLNTAKTLHGFFNMTLDGQTLSGTVNTEVWTKSPDENRTLVAQSTVFQFPTGSLVVSNGKQIWQYDPTKKVVYTGSASSSAANGTPTTGPGIGGGGSGTGRSQFIFNLVRSIFTRSKATLVSSMAKVNGHDAYDVHVIPQVSAKGTPEAGDNFDYEGEVYIDKASSLPLKLDLTISSFGHVVLDLPNLMLNAPLPDSLFTYAPPAGVKVLPLQAANANPGTGSLTLVQAQQQAGYHLLSIPASQTAYQLQGVDALGAPGNQIYTLNYLKGATSFTISEGKSLANLPSDGGQSVSLRATTANLSTSSGLTTLAWTENGVGIRIVGNLGNDAIIALAKLLV